MVMFKEKPQPPENPNLSLPTYDSPTLPRGLLLRAEAPSHEFRSKLISSLTHPSPLRVPAHLPTLPPPGPPQVPPWIREQEKCHRHPYSAPSSRFLGDHFPKKPLRRRGPTPLFSVASSRLAPLSFPLTHRFAICFFSARPYSFPLVPVLRTCSVVGTPRDDLKVSPWVILFFSPHASLNRPCLFGFRALPCE